MVREPGSTRSRARRGTAICQPISAAARAARIQPGRQTAIHGRLLELFASRARDEDLPGRRDLHGLWRATPRRRSSSAKMDKNSAALGRDTQRRLRQPGACLRRRLHPNAIDVYGADAGVLKSSGVQAGRLCEVNRASGEMWVFSWMIPSRLCPAPSPVHRGDDRRSRDQVCDDPEALAPGTLAWRSDKVGRRRVRGDPTCGTWMVRGRWTSGTDPPTVWLGRGRQRRVVGGDGNGGHLTAAAHGGATPPVPGQGRQTGSRPGFGEETAGRSSGQAPSNANQRLYVNPPTGKLYLGEARQRADGASVCNAPIEIDPETGKIRISTPVQRDGGRVRPGGQHLPAANTAHRAATTRRPGGKSRWTTGASAAPGGRRRRGADRPSGGRGLTLPSNRRCATTRAGSTYRRRAHLASCAYLATGISRPARHGPLQGDTPCRRQDQGGKEYSRPSTPAASST